MSKTICKWKKEDMGENGCKLRKVTKKPTFYCQKCGRVANKKSLLCKADSFKKVKLDPT